MHQEDEEGFLEQMIEEEWEMRNISGMSERHRAEMEGRSRPLEASWERKRSALRRRLGTFGLASGVNPGIVWPTPTERAELVAEERMMEPSLAASKDVAFREAETERRLLAERTASVERNLKLYPKVLKEWESRHVAAETERAEIEAERQEKILAIQEHFGYAVDPSDPRFQQMMAQKEEDERKAARLARKKEKEAMLVASIKEQQESL